MIPCYSMCKQLKLLVIDEISWSERKVFPLTDQLLNEIQRRVVYQLLFLRLRSFGITRPKIIPPNKTSAPTINHSR